LKFPGVLKFSMGISLGKAYICIACISVDVGIRNGCSFQVGFRNKDCSIQFCAVVFIWMFLCPGHWQGSPYKGVASKT
jgi:hypothetical protein